VFLADPFGGYTPQVDIHIVRDGRQARGFFKIMEEADSWSPKALAEPEGWEAYHAEEQRYVQAEVDRLFYVAATRAKDQLVLGRYAGKSGRRTASWDVLTATLANATPLAVPDDAAPAVMEPADAAAAHMSSLAREVAERHARTIEPTWTASSVTAEAKRLPQAAEEAVAADDPTQVIVPRTPSHRADAGLAWGTLVHGLLEHAMRHRSATRADLHRLARWLTLEEPRLKAMIDQAIDTALAVVSSGDLASARESDECHEEVPFAVRDLATRVPRVTTGAIDLVHRAGDGWRLVDYKTDVGLDDREAQQKYFAQIRAYADAWRRVAGGDVRTDIVPVRT
jgi:ATP-dependent helicase/nuclease subunit A